MLSTECGLLYLISWGILSTSEKCGIWEDKNIDRSRITLYSFCASSRSDRNWMQTLRRNSMQKKYTNWKNYVEQKDQDSTAKNFSPTWRDTLCVTGVTLLPLLFWRMIINIHTDGTRYMAEKWLLKPMQMVQYSVQYEWSRYVYGVCTCMYFKVLNSKLTVFGQIKTILNERLSR